MMMMMSIYSEQVCVRTRTDCADYFFSVPFGMIPANVWQHARRGRSHYRETTRIVAVAARGLINRAKERSDGEKYRSPATTKRRRENMPGYLLLRVPRDDTRADSKRFVRRSTTA